MEFVDTLRSGWNNFINFEFAAEALLLFGAVLVLIAALKIIGSGLRLAFWVFIAFIGVVSVSYGMNGSSIDLPGTRDRLTELGEPGRELSSDVLEVLCRRLYEGR